MCRSAPVDLLSRTPCGAGQGNPAVYGEPVLSDEQLADIIASISRDVIERIAWEVVPDLAETLIREEIRKLKKGCRSKQGM